jgi:membrane protein implicated in regulation of membrane protease activity
MFSKEECKQLIVALGKRWLFPDFNNKVTWAIISLGTIVVATPTPFKVLFTNWLIDTFSLNSGIPLTLADVGSAHADYWLGFFLIISALFYNLIYKWFEWKNSAKQLQDSKDQLAADRALFQKFIQEFPSTSPSLNLLQSHDFGNAFHLDALRDLDHFVEKWRHAETNFLSTELNNLKIEFWKKSCEFEKLLAYKSAPIRGGGMQSVVPDQHRNEWSWPDWVNEDVKAVNNLSSEVAHLHQNLILEAKRTLRC